MRAELLSRVAGLRSGRTPFVLATVVRAERPTSAKPGDCALVLADGTIDGFVGGACAESTVRLESLRLLQAGESGLLRITPRADDDQAAEEGVRTVGNPCLSGGTLEIFLEAMIPPALVSVYGEAPVARALVRVGHALDWDVRASIDPTTPIAPDTSAVVVASHGRDEAAVLRAALDAGVSYVALVASRRRAAGVLEELAALGVAPALRGRIHAPAGLDIGARTAPEIALSVFAEIVEHRPEVARPEDGSATAGPVSGVALDPVCGMQVAVTAASISAQHGGVTTYFCGTGCRQAFLDDPQRFPR
ncbi:XdhC family protein [Pseudonocardia xinjiangensis]|uniref:YHS domain-containing protein n=1 Tax=Pseudonocardia xinjiangensis TaxID=75289 RepID=A0ABX1RSZ6_9PSEU|nr:XdhC family protein [Pseudonocardia xinjiangensis]NMH82205.1 YHS domain-containing protein [Pseudonocardia xinjiangensis]